MQQQLWRRRKQQRRRRKQQQLRRRWKQKHTKLVKETVIQCRNLRWHVKRVGGLRSAETIMIAEVGSIAI